MNRPNGKLVAGTLVAALLALSASQAAAQEVAPALRFAPDPGAGTKSVAVPQIFVMPSVAEKLLSKSQQTAAAVAPTPTAPEPQRAELQSARQGSGDGGFQLLDVTQRKAGTEAQGLTLTERKRAVQEFRQSLLSNAAVVEKGQ